MPHKACPSPRFIDSHLHLGDYESPLQALSFASFSGGLLVSAGTGAQDSRKGVTLSEEHPSLVKAFVGVHPSEAGSKPLPNWLERLLPRATGVGEIGLDPKYSAVGRGSLQVNLFHFQLALAEKADKPVHVHSRGAERECLDILGTFAIRTVLLHWFQGDQLLEEANGRGYYASFGPALLFSKKLRRMARSWNKDRLLVESDGPIRFAGLGGVGGPWLVPSVVFQLAMLTGTSPEETGSLIAKNSLQFLMGDTKPRRRSADVSKA